MKITFTCEGCEEEYTSLDEAFFCETQDPGAPSVKVGAIVTTGRYFGWFNGNPKWVILPTSGMLRSDRADRKCPEGNGNCFETCCNYTFYYVVTATEVYQHRIRYSLATRAMKDPQGYRYERTFSAPTKVENPTDYLVRSSHGLLGELAQYMR